MHRGLCYIPQRVPYNCQWVQSAGIPLSQLVSVTRCCQASDIRFWRVPTTSYKPSHRHTHTHTVSSFSEKTPGGIPSTQIKRETQLKHLAINSFISMSHKQCYRSAAVAATTAAAAASVEAEAATASGARYASITPCCSCYAVILCLFSEQSHTKRRGTASHLKRDCSALLNVAVLRGDNCVLRLLLCLLIRTDLCLPPLGLG